MQNKETVVMLLCLTSLFSVDVVSVKLWKIKLSTCRYKVKTYALDFRWYGVHNMMLLFDIHDNVDTIICEFDISI